MSENNEMIVSPEAPVAAPAPAEPKKEESNKEKIGNSFTEVFMARLKEQSFTILLMLAVVYYQHMLWQEDKLALTKEVDQKEERILEVVEREHARSIERERVLESQKEQFIELLKQQAAWQQAQSGR